MPHSRQPLEITLETQAGSLRALACSLLGDEHAADDVLQDTWLKAADKAPIASDRTGSADGWLRRVVSNLSRNYRRADRSRLHHEGGAARSEQLAATDEIAAEREVMRLVLGAVSNLEEPYQSVILMRYYQGLAPRFIAQERGIPVATIKSQLSRGLNVLRERLDALSGGDRDQWAGVLAVSVGVGEGAKVGMIALAGSVVLAASVAVATGIWMFGGDAPVHGESQSAPVLVAAQGEHERELSPVAAAAQEPDKDSSAEEVRVDAPARVAVNEKLPWNTAAPLPPYQFSMRFEVVQNSDLPIPGSSVLLAPSGHPLNEVGRTDRSGVLEVEWRGYEPAMKMTFGIKRTDYLLQTALSEVEVKSSVVSTVRIPVGHQGVLDRAQAGPQKPAIERLSALGYVAEQSLQDQTPLLESALSAERDEESGEVRFVWQVVSEEVIMDHNETAAGAMFGSLGYSGASFEVEEDVDAKPTSFYVTGQVLRASGEPAVKAWVSASMGEAGTDRTMLARTDEEGRYEFEVEAQESLVLRAGGGEFGLAERKLTLNLEEFAERVEWSPLLDRGHEVLGLINVDGKPMKGDWIAEWELADGPSLYADLGCTLNSGFSFANLPRGQGRLLLSHQGSWPLAVGVSDSWSPSVLSEPIDVKVADREGVDLEILVIGPDGAALDAPVQLWQASSNRAIYVRFDRKSESYRRAAVPAGMYSVRVGDSSTGYVEAGPFQVSLEEPVVVGPITIEPACTLRLTVDGELPEARGVAGSKGRAAGWVWSLTRREFGVESICYLDPFLEENALAIAAGTYRLELSGPEFAMPPVELTIAAGETRTVDIALKQMGEVVVLAQTEDESAQVFRVLDEAGTADVHQGTLLQGEAARFSLPAGEYVLEIAGQRQPISVTAGERLVL